MSSDDRSMKSVSFTIRLVAAMAWCLLGARVSAQDSATEATSETREESPLQQLIDESVGWFELTAGPHAEKLLRAMPVLRWDNNVRGSASGLTVLYIGDGRPEAICSIYPWDGQLVHEFDSLSRGAIRATENGDVFWRPDKPGVVFQAIPDAPDPHNQRTVRLRQMKRLMQRFGATLVGWEADDSDRQALRPLPREIYRYKRQSGDVLDGAVFAFVMGVDPEVLLLIEAVEIEGTPRWEYAFVRQSSGELAGTLDGENVWTVERFPKTQDPDGLSRTVRHPLELSGSRDTALGGSVDDP
jgi:hypothetical protein